MYISSKTDFPLVTLGMPVYNEEKNISQAIESLLAQTYKNFILLISDNASTDRTPEICEYYSKKDSRVRRIRQKENMGAMLNYKYLVDKTETPFFMWCSGNDRWHPTFLEKLLPELEKNEDVILSYSGAVAINPDGSVLPQSYNEDYSTAGIKDPVQRYLYFLRHFRVRLSNMLYGIWRVEALRNCSLALPVAYVDTIILYQAVLEGEFKMRKEVLFWMGKPSAAIKTRKERLIREEAILTGKKLGLKAGAFNFFMASFFATIRVPLNKRYKIAVVKRVWLFINALFVAILTFFVEPALNAVLEKILPEEVYIKLKSAWRKIMYKGN